MEEPAGAQYALQIALNTLKDRCLKFQQRIAVLEEENLNLRVQCSRNETTKSSLSEIDSLKEKMAELTEQKGQLQNKVKIVTSENQELWEKLSKLTNVNKNLGNQLLRINESLTQHTKNMHSPLIRSKTFTQDEPQTRALQKNLEENGKISLELEDVSLKMMNSFAKEKSEIESICAKISEMQCGDDNLITNSFCLNYDDEFDDVLVKDFENIVDEMSILKTVVVEQQKMLKESLNYVNKLNEKKANIKKKTVEDKSTSTENLALQNTEVEDTQPNESTMRICPMCSKHYPVHMSEEQFVQHVESHFIDESYELL